MAGLIQDRSRLSDELLITNIQISNVVTEIEGREDARLIEARVNELVPRLSNFD
jgi:hypothetical protein